MSSRGKNDNSKGEMRVTKNWEGTSNEEKKEGKDYGVSKLVRWTGLISIITKSSKLNNKPGLSSYLPTQYLMVFTFSYPHSI